MTRIARFVEANGYYHVISRSINETWIFKDHSDFNYFCFLERELKNKFPIKLFHYVLMNTHFHFVLQAKSKRILSAHMHQLKWNYTQWMRRKYGWRGPLWRERYKSIPIENESYLAACGFYVEFNPVRAGICDDPSKYPYSSYHKYFSETTDDLIDEHEVDFKLASTLPIKDQPELSKLMFSNARAIGSRLFVEKCNPKNACPLGDSHQGDCHQGKG